MNTRPAASILIPVLNGEKTIGELLIALKAQAGVSGGFEIIVVDNGSTDRTVEVVQSHGITPLHQPKRGPSAARNMGLAQARGDAILCIDSDCIPTRRWATSLVATISDPEVGVATGPIHGWQPMTGAERYISAKDTATQQKTAEHPMHPWAYGMNTTVRREDALAVGGWDETMGSGEDMDFCFKLQRRFGKPIRFVEQAILFHKHRSSDEALWKQARWHGAGYALLYQRHPDIIEWPRYRTPSIYFSFFTLTMGAPIVWAGNKLGLMSRERAEFERYHRRWFWEFWQGFFEEKRKHTA